LKPRFVSYLAAVALLVSLIAASAAVPAIADSGVTIQIALAGTGSPTAGEFTPSGSATDLEFVDQASEADPASFDGTISRSLSRGSGSGGLVTASAKKAKSNPQVDTSFEGLNFYQQRYSRGGNQFSVEPPDQGLCVGNGYIVEAVNDVFNVFNSAGASVLPDNTSANIVGGHPRNVNHAIDLNSFFKYPPAIDRGNGNVRGPSVTDPSCYYDAQTQRFYLVALTYNLSKGQLVENHLDVAVSATSNPTGIWNIYKVDVTNDGTHTIPDNACPCLGDYPHIGADANGFYVTTNSYPWNGNGFNGAQLYAFSKRQLASGAATVNVTHIDTFASVTGAMTGETPSLKQPGFTVWPAESPGTDSYELGAGGTEYFLSSNAADEATHPVAGTGGNYISSQVVLWALTNTSSLDSSTPSVSLANTVLAVGQYALPPKAHQPGSGSAPTTATPQGYCLNNETTVTVFNVKPGCWHGLVGAGVHASRGAEVGSRLDSNDTRMQQVMYANGKVWGALDSAVTTSGANHAGVAWYIVKPDVSTGSVAGKIALTGTNGVEGKNVMYPAIGVTPSGRGVVALTLSGSNDFPSAAYAAIDAQAGMGEVQIVAAGAATDDGFTSYKQQLNSPTPRTRWGDYGAAAVDGSSIWIASEYIAHACDYTAWGGPFIAGGSGDNLLGTCSGSPDLPGTRAALGNWSTRITKITP
jgi:hypothetical protein